PINVGVAAGFVRMLLLIAAPIVIAVVALLTDTDIGGGKCISALSALLVVSLRSLGFHSAGCGEGGSAAAWHRRGSSQKGDDGGSTASPGEQSYPPARPRG